LTRISRAEAIEVQNLPAVYRSVTNNEQVQREGFDLHLEDFIRYDRGQAADSPIIVATNDNVEDSLERFRRRVLGDLSAIFAQSTKESILEHALQTAFMRGALAGATHGGGAVVELAYRDQAID
jgi:hypothetical protein